jgi:hypothetical protein
MLEIQNNAGILGNKFVTRPCGETKIESVFVSPQGRV